LDYSELTDYSQVDMLDPRYKFVKFEAGKSPGSTHPEQSPGSPNWRDQETGKERVFKAHRLLYHSTLSLRVTKKKKTKELGGTT